MINAVMLSYTKDEDIYQMTLEALTSVKDCAPASGLKIVLVETNENLKSEPWYTEEYPADAILFKPDFSFNRSLAFGKAWFENVERTDYFLALNNDIVAHPGCFDKMMENLKPAGRFDCVSAWSMTTEVQRGFTGVVEGYTAGRAFSGWAWMCCESMFVQKSFDTYFPPKFAFWYQDNYFIDVMLLYGKRHALVCDARIDHLESRSHRLLTDAQELTHGQERIYRNNAH